MIAQRRHFLQEHDIHVETYDGGGPNHSAKNIYSKEVSARIKSNIKREWELQKRHYARTQEHLAESLSISQSAVSKLLNDKDGHPWSVDKIELFANFCNVPIKRLIGDTELMGHFSGWKTDIVAPSGQRIGEAKYALANFIGQIGARLDDVKLHKLAGQLAVDVEETDRSTKSYNAAIIKLLISEASQECS